MYAFWINVQGIISIECCRSGEALHFNGRLDIYWTFTFYSPGILGTSGSCTKETEIKIQLSEEMRQIVIDLKL